MLFSIFFSLLKFFLEINGSVLLSIITYFRKKNAALDFTRKPILNSDFTLKESLPPLDFVWSVNN